MIVHGLHASWCVRWLAVRLCEYLCVFSTCASERVCYSLHQNRYTYDRSQIALWIQRAQQNDQEIRSPHTNEVLAHEMLTPNHSLRNIIMQNAIV